MKTVFASLAILACMIAFSACASSGDGGAAPAPATSGPKTGEVVTVQPDSKSGDLVETTVTLGVERVSGAGAPPSDVSRIANMYSQEWDNAGILRSLLGNNTNEAEWSGSVAANSSVRISYTVRTRGRWEALAVAANDVDIDMELIDSSGDVEDSDWCDDCFPHVNAPGAGEYVVRIVNTTGRSARVWLYTAQR